MAKLIPILKATEEKEWLDHMATVRTSSITFILARTKKIYSIVMVFYAN